VKYGVGSCPALGGCRGPMEVTFTKLAGQRYATSIRRSDGVVFSLRAAGASSAMPHDLAHLVIERELGLREGFWGCVAGGAVIPGMSVVSGRRRPHAKERSRAILKHAGQRTTEAEVAVSVVLEIALSRRDERAPDRACVQLNEAWRPTGKSRPAIEAEGLGRVCTAVRAAQAHWHSLLRGESWELCWPLAAPKVGSRPFD